MLECEYSKICTDWLHVWYDFGVVNVDLVDGYRVQNYNNILETFKRYSRL